jgi:hypothetical protein
MGWTFYDVASLPEPGEIVWCKWPLRERKGEPGPWARPSLVWETFVRDDPVTGARFGSVIVSYGTGEVEPERRPLDLVIAPMARARELGLHKPTRFSLDPSDRKHLLWCREFFVASSYLRDQDVRIGRLGEPELRQLRERLAARGLVSEDDSTS